MVWLRGGWDSNPRSPCGLGTLALSCTRPGYAPSPGVPSTAGCAQSTGEVALLLVKRWVRALGLFLGVIFGLGLLLDLARLLLHFALQLVDLAAPLRRAVARDLAELLLHLALGLLHLALDPIVHVAPPGGRGAGRVPP